jgi:hypothetical protein
MSEVINLIASRLEDINVKEMTAIQASTAMAAMRKRIHVDGKDSNDSQIGTYTPAYIKVRTGIYKDSKVSGKKEVVKSAGNKTKGKSKGSERPKYQRSADPKVILSLTGEMEQQMIIIPIENGCGIGYSNEENFLKSQYNEKTYKKKIFNLTKDERADIMAIGQDYINDTLK